MPIPNASYSTLKAFSKFGRCITGASVIFFLISLNSLIVAFDPLELALLHTISDWCHDCTKSMYEVAKESCKPIKIANLMNVLWVQANPLWP